MNRVEIQLAGFKKAIREKADVLVNTDTRVDMQLEAGDISQSVEVVDSLPLLQTDRADVGRQIEIRQLQDMPLTFNRNFQSLVNLVPGATRAHREHSEFFNSQDSLATEVNGQSRYANNVQIEGIDNNHRTGLLQVLIPPIEALSSVDITTSNYEAELGRAGGAVVNATIRSGNNDLHGSVYEFMPRQRACGAQCFCDEQSAHRLQPIWIHARRPDRQKQDFLLWRLPGDPRSPRRCDAADNSDDEFPEWRSEFGAQYAVASNHL